MSDQLGAIELGTAAVTMSVAAVQHFEATDIRDAASSLGMLHGVLELIEDLDPEERTKAVERVVQLATAGWGLASDIEGSASAQDLLQHHLAHEQK